MAIRNINQLFDKTKYSIDNREPFIFHISVGPHKMIDNDVLHENLDFFLQVALSITKTCKVKWGHHRQAVEDIIELREQNV